MSRQRRNFSAKFKSDLVIELLKGEKDLNTLAVENNIQPNLLRNWKKEFLDNASIVFDEKREDNLKTKLLEERREKEQYAKKVGQLTMQVDWLKKNLRNFVDLTTKVSLVQSLLNSKGISTSTGAKLLGINRTSIYYQAPPISEEELKCKEIIDHLHTNNPAWGARQMSAQLKARGYHVGRRKARRYMNEMDITPIYPKMNLSKRMQQAKVFPYLLRNVAITKPNQTWSIDITYIPIKRGFVYLTAIIDWYSRYIVGFEVDDTLGTIMVINALSKALKIGKPQILNSDQGSQFTGDKYISFVKEQGIRQSMDGKSRWADNIMIERRFFSFKYEEAYLTQYENMKHARQAIARYINIYNYERRHSSINYQTPAECYYQNILTQYVA